MKEQERIRELLEAQLADSPFFVVDVLVSRSKITPKVTIALDGDTGIGIDACADVSRELDKQIEAEELFPKGYVLEVSSPGIDQPLKLPRQYAQHTGRQLRVQLRDGSLKTGKLESVAGDEIILLQETTNKANKKKKEITSVSILIQDIDKAFVLVSFK